MLKSHSDCKILCVTEHWRTAKQLRYLAIRNFKLGASFCRENGKHGGSAVYVHKNIKCSPKTKINKLSVTNEFEYAAIECNLNGTQIIVVSVYRPPSGDVNRFLDSIEALLSGEINENKKIVIAGDFNIEMLKENVHRTNLLSLLQSFNLKQSIFVNTRIVKNSASCIDNIFVNFEYTDGKVLDTFISDHTAQKVSFQLKQCHKNILQYRRNFSEQNKSLFINYLKEQDWAQAYELHDINAQWNMFMNNFVNIFNHCFPLKLVNTNHKYKTHDDPRITQSKKKLDLLLTLNTFHNSFKEQYSNAKREYDNLLKAVRSEEYEKRLRVSDNKTKCMWNLCKEITGQTDKNCDIGIRGNPEKIPDQYNKYLLSVVPELLKGLDSRQFNCKIEENNQSLFLRPISTTELCDFAKKIKNKHSCGVDEIPTSIVKMVIPVIKDVLCYLINNSFKQGIFPEQLKIALIKPLFKKGDPEIMENYRPISLLPAFSKLFELAMCHRLIDFLNKCKLLNNNQHGFIAGKSTQTAIIFQYTKNILNCLEKGDISCGICLDLSKAYDCIDPMLLLRKLELYGIRGNALRLFKSYLTGRQQKVKITQDGQTYLSSLMENKLGIAQGSIAGPILFVIFLDDLISIVTSPDENVTCYADDTNLITSAENIEELVLRVLSLFKKANEWFSGNKLILNKNKTNILLFRTKQLKVNKPHSIALGKSDIELVEHTKFLGIYLDEFLNWSQHINLLIPRLNSVCYGIRVIGKYMSEKTLKIIYYANFESILKYGIMFWGSNSLTEKIFIVQKRALRILKKMNFNESCRNVFKECGILTVYGVYIYECLLFFFKNRNMFELQTFHEHHTRTQNVTYPIHRLTLTEKNPNYMCLKLFNNLPNTIKCINTLKLFKIIVKNLLLNLEPYSLEDFILN